MSFIVQRASRVDDIQNAIGASHLGASTADAFCFDDIGVVAKAGGPIVAAVTLSLLLLGGMSLLLVRLLGIA